MTTIPINLIQLHYFDDVINTFNLSDLEILWMNCVFIDSKQETINCKGSKPWKSFYLFSLVSDELPSYLLFPIVLSGLPTGYLLLAAHWSPQISHVWRITRNVCENPSFEKIRTIPINLIQLHHFDDVINAFNLIDLEKRWMSCVFIDLKQETINCKRSKPWKSFYLISLVSDGLTGYLATYCFLLCWVGYQRAICCW